MSQNCFKQDALGQDQLISNLNSIYNLNCLLSHNWTRSEALGMRTWMPLGAHYFASYRRTRDCNFVGMWNTWWKFRRWKNTLLFTMVEILNLSKNQSWKYFKRDLPWFDVDFKWHFKKINALLLMPIIYNWRWILEQKI